MTTFTITLILLSITEIAILGVVVFFFTKLRKSEEALSRMQARNDEMLTKLRFSTQLENELVQSFENRLEQLSALEQAMQHREAELRELLQKAEKMTKSPAFLHAAVLTGYRDGKTKRQLAQESGLSVEEIELILEREQA
jgi:uncharacterized protein HemX